MPMPPPPGVENWERLNFDPGPLGPEQVEVAVEYFGICHSDLSMIDNEWGQTRHQHLGAVPGHP